MLRLLLPPNLAVAAPRNAIAVRLYLLTAEEIALVEAATAPISKADAPLAPSHAD